MDSVLLRFLISLHTKKDCLGFLNQGFWGIDVKKHKYTRLNPPPPT